MKKLLLVLIAAVMILGFNHYLYAGGSTDTMTTTTNLMANATVTFDLEYVNGNSGASKAITWANGNKQSIVLTGAPDCTVTFVNPAGPCHVTLKVTQGAGGSKTATWSGNFKWQDATPPTLSTVAGAIDIIVFYFDGTYYYGVGALNFS